VTRRSEKATVGRNVEFGQVGTAEASASLQIPAFPLIVWIPKIDDIWDFI
jgi:hypothetical protein